MTFLGVICEIRFRHNVADFEDGNFDLIVGLGILVDEIGKPWLGVIVCVYNSQLFLSLPFLFLLYLNYSMV